MAELMSNLLRAVMLTEDITTGVAAPSRSQCYTIQHFNYKCARNRDGHGMPFGFTTSVIMRSTVKVGAGKTGKTFLERLKQDSRYPFTFIFNPTFDAERKISDYEGAMVVYGYVVDVEQTHGEASALSFNILVSSITYLGADSNKTLFISYSKD